MSENRTREPPEQELGIQIVNRDIWLSGLTAPCVGATVPLAAFLIDPAGAENKRDRRNRVSLQYRICTAVLCDSQECLQLCSSHDLYLFKLKIETSGQRT